MWCETHARAPLARQNVLLSSAPQARIGAPRGLGQRQARRARTRASGAASAAGRRPTRTTESSVRVRIGRSWSRNASAIPASRATRVAVLERDRLVGDVARWSSRAARRASASSRWCSGVYGSITPELARARRDGRRDGARPPAAARARSAARASAAAAPPPRPSSTSAAAAATSGDHQRERLVLAVLARPQRRHRALVGRHAGEVEPAEPLDRDHPAAEQRRHRRPTGSDPWRASRNEARV